MNADTCLNLILPAGLEEAVADLLLAYPEMPVSFATFPVQAHGAEVALLAPSEHVSGHAHRVQMQLVLNRSDAETVLAYLRTALPNPAVFYWVSPVLASGRLG